jgi:hypothetical protein
MHAWARSRSRAVELKMNAKAGSTAPRRDSKLVGPVPQPRSDGGRPRVHERGETAGAGRRGSSSASNRREEERESVRARTPDKIAALIHVPTRLLDGLLVCLDCILCKRVMAFGIKERRTTSEPNVSIALCVKESWPSK